jgi:deoxyribonuclease-1
MSAQVRALAFALVVSLLLGCPRSDAPSPTGNIEGSTPSAQASAMVADAPAADRRVEPPSKPRSFKDAKRALRVVYDATPHETLYAGCAFEKWRVDWSRCCLKREGKRARLEWEHVVPASAFGRKFREWTEGHPDCVKRTGKPFKGRRCATRTSDRFSHMEGDMHNLMPSLGAINGARSWYPVALIDGEERRFGSCDVEVKDERFEPRPAARGELARAYLYMADAYPEYGILDGETRPMMQKWHEADPPNSWERERNGQIQKLQGNLNPWISK